MTYEQVQQEIDQFLAEAAEREALGKEVLHYSTRLPEQKKSVWERIKARKSR